jgi:hypothetical protein
MTTCSMAFTRRLVALMTSSKIVNAVYKRWSGIDFSFDSLVREPRAYLQRSELDQRPDGLDIGLS